MCGKKASTPSEKWIKAVESAVLALSDQQIVTGLAILVSAYSQFQCGLAVYHWQVTVDLAWFSSITHLTTLTCLRTYLQQRGALKLLRVVFMTITAVILACALGSTGFLSTGGVNINLPAQCLYNPGIMTVLIQNSDVNQVQLYDYAYIAFTFLFLAFSYLTRIAHLYPTTLKWPETIRRTSPRMLLLGRLDSLSSKIKSSTLLYIDRNSWYQHFVRLIRILLYRTLLSLYCITQASAELWASMMWEVRLSSRGALPPLTHQEDYLALPCAHLGHDPYIRGP